MLYDLLIWINYLLAGSLILFLLLPLQLEVIAWLTRRRARHTSDKNHFFSCIITSFGDPGQCKLLIDSILASSYTEYEVVVVIDGTDKEFAYSHHRVRILRPAQTLNSKLRSIESAMNLTSEESEGIIILDPDNLMHPEFLRKINGYFLSPFVAVQGRRKAKNINTPIARTDALNESYYNIADRKLPFRAGSSASLAGSGMCISRSLLEIFLKNFIPSDPSKVVFGEDKLMQNFLVRQGYRIAYAETAVIYDEKTISANQLVRQRARWLNAYFENVRGAAQTFLSGLASADWNRVVFGIHTLKPPLFINISVLTAILLINLWLNPWVSVLAGASLAAFILYFLVKVIRLKLVSGLYALPEFWLNQLIAFFLHRNYQKEFGKTNTTAYLSISEVLKKDNLP